MSSILAAVQQEIADCLLADPFFATIPVLVEQPLDLTYGLQQSVAAGAVYIVVLVPLARVSSPTAPGPFFDAVEVTLRVHENVPLTAAPHALEIAETALALLHLFHPPTFNEVVTAAPLALQRFEEPDRVGYEVRVVTQALAAYSVPMLALPAVTLAVTAGQTVATLAAAPPGAALFFTSDGSQPAPNSPTATLYLLPFTIASGTTLRARAWLAGYLASPELRLTIP